MKCPFHRLNYGKPYRTCGVDDVSHSKYLYRIKSNFPSVETNVNLHADDEHLWEAICDNNNPYGVYYERHHLLRMSRTALHT